MIARTSGRMSSGLSLFMTGAVAAARSASLHASNVLQNGSRPTGSTTFGRILRRKPGSVKSSGRAASVIPGIRASVSSDAPRMSWVRGPQ